MHILWICFQLLVTFKLQSNDNEHPYRLLGQSISNISAVNDSLFIASNKGLQFSTDLGLNWKNSFFPSQNSIIRVFMDSKNWIWVSTGKDTLIAGDRYNKGTGIHISKDGAKTWIYIAQGIDPKSNFDSTKIEIPVTTTINNLSYDIQETIDSVTQERRIWVASFAGSLRYILADSIDGNMSANAWILVNVNGKKLNVAQNNSEGYAQRTFALASDTKTLWVGTANGIYKSTDYGNNFINLSHIAGNITSLSANFITAMYYKNRILFAQAKIVSSGQEQATNILDLREDMDSQSFTRIFSDLTVYRYFTQQKQVFCASNAGLLVLDSNYNELQRISNIRDAESELQFTSNQFYDILIHQSKIWLASSEGLAIGDLNFSSWKILKSRTTLESTNIEKLIAFPSPYSPRHNAIEMTFSFILNSDSEVRYSIYNIAMEKVFENRVFKTKSEVATIRWNGKNGHGDYLNNGVYFLSIKSDEGQIWTKFIIAN